MRFLLPAHLRQLLSDATEMPESLPGAADENDTFPRVAAHSSLIVARISVQDMGIGFMV